MKISSIVLSVLFFQTQSTMAQTSGPAGITTGLKTWIKADAGITQDANGVNTWADQSGLGNDFAQGTNNEKPDFISSYANYNPSIQFDGDKHNMEISTNLVDKNSKDLDCFVVGVNNSGGDGYPVFLLGQTNSADWDNGGYGITANVSGANFTSWVDEWDKNVVSKAWQDEPQAILEGSYDGDTVRLFFNSEIEGTDNFNKKVGDGGMNTFIGGENKSYNLNGYISEIIVYDDNLSLANKQKINSYLAIKYGITLSANTDGAGASFQSPNGNGIHEGDYVKSNGTVIWDASAAAATYHNNVVGIGKDNDSELDQRKSKSENDGAALVLDNNGAFGGNGRFLVAGSNVLTGMSSTNVPAGYTSISSRIWKTQKTGSVTGTTVRFILSEMGFTNSGNAADYALMIDATDTDFSAGATTHTTGATISGDTLTFTGANLSNGFIALASSIAIPASIFYATQDGDWDDIRWSLVGRNGGDADPGLPTANDDVVIDGWEVGLDHADVEIGNITITNAGNDKGKLTIETGDNLSVTGDVHIIAKNKNKDIELKVKNASALVINGNLTVDFDAAYNRDKNVKLKIENTATATVDGFYSVNINNTDGGGKKYLDLKDAGVFTCQSGVVINQSGGTGDARFWIEDDAIWNVNGGFTVNKSGGVDTEIWLNNGGGGAGTAAQLNITGDLTVNRTGGDDIVFRLDQASSYINVGGNLNLTHMGVDAANDIDFEINNGATLDVDGNVNMTAVAQATTFIELNNNSKMEIAGNFNRVANFGSLDCNGTSTVEYNGVSSAQQFAQDTKGGAGTDRFTYQNVIINNTFGTSPQLTMEGDATVNGTLTLTDGVISSSSTEMLIIADGGGASSGSVDSHVDGPLRKIGDGDFVFPVGKGGTWARMGISSLSNSNGSTEFTAEYFDAAAPNPSNLGTGLDHVSGNEYWDLERTLDAGNDAGCNVTLYWESATNSGINIGSLGDLAVAHYDGSLWQNHTGAAAGGATGSILSGTPITSFSPITFSSKGGANPLPIELISFEAHLNIDQVDLKWITASELNNDYFTVERSRDGLHFEEVLRVDGMLESNQTIEYVDVDYSPLVGVTYYRLKQTDIDGKYTYSGLVPLEYTGTEEPGSSLASDVESGIKIWPTVSDGTHVNIEISGYDREEEVFVIVRDISGKEFYSKVLITDMDGHVVSGIDPSQTLAVGTYLVVGSDKNHMYSKKLIVR